MTVVLALLAGAGRIIAPLTVQHVDRRRAAPHVVGPAVVRSARWPCWSPGCRRWLLNRRLQHRVETALADLRRAGLRRVHDMPAATADRMPSADLVARLTSDLDQVTTFLQGGGLSSSSPTLAQLLIATGLMLVYSWQLAAAGASCSPACCSSSMRWCSG